MRLLFACAVVLLLTNSVFAADAVPDGANEYLDGMSSLENAKWADAAKSLSKAIDADEENPDYRIAYGVALIFSDKPADATKPLQRAMKLRPNDKTAKLWMATAVGMQGDFMHDSDWFPAATRDVYETAVREMSHHYGEWAFRSEEAKREQTQGWGNGRLDPNGREGKLLADARAQFPDLAKQFVSKAEAELSQNNPGIAALIKQRGIAKAQSSDFSGALPDLERQLAANPTDPALLAAHASAVLALGAPALARMECTWALTRDVNRADAYVTRAIAAARLGDLHRAGSDLSIAAALRPATAAKDRAAVEAAAAVGPPAFKPEELQQRLEELHQMAAQNTPWEALVAEATSIIKGENSVRKMFDEDYQDRLRALTWAVGREPNKAEPRAQLGEFLYRGVLGIRGESVEPRAVFHSYRLIGNNGENEEMTRAGAVLDSALKIDPNSFRALTAKAGVLMWRNDWASAQQLLKHALEIRSDDPELLHMFARVLDHLAAVKADQAASERTPRSWEDAFYIYTRYPSAAEKAEADELDRQAQELWNMASESLSAAARKAKGTAEGAYLSSVVARRNSNADEALADLQEAIRLAPENAEYHDALADVYNERGMRDQTADERTSAVNLLHSTAGPTLRLVWLQIPMTQYKSAKKSLKRAMEFDPADARSLAYMGMIYLADEKPDDALGWLRAAAAMDEAQGRFEGRSVTNTSLGAMPPLKTGLTLNVLRNVGSLLLKANRAAEAAPMLQLAVAAGMRVPAGRWYEQSPSSMLPTENPDTTTVVPACYSTADLLAWSHYYLGASHAALNKPREARAEYVATLKLKSDAPHVVDVGMRIRLPVAYAALALAKDYMAHNDPKDALDALNGNGPSYQQDPQMAQEFNELFNQIRMKMDGANTPEQQRGYEVHRPGPHY